MRILGIDPGITGGLSVVEISDGAAPTLVACIDIPVVGGGAKERVDVAAVYPLPGSPAARSVIAEPFFGVCRLLWR